MLGLWGSSGEIPFFCGEVHGGSVRIGRRRGSGGGAQVDAVRVSRRAREYSGGMAVGIRWAGCGRGMCEADEIASG